MEDNLRVCIDCGKPFFTEVEKRFYEEHGLTFPTRCKQCREKRKKAREERDRNLAEERARKEIQASMTSCGITFSEIDAVINRVKDSAVLFVIGNGFDLFHGVPSSYHQFGATIGKRNRLRDAMEWIIDCDDLWGDFEASLAKVNRETLMRSVETMIAEVEIQDPKEEEFSQAEYEAALDIALSPINMLQFELPRRFRKWVNSLECSSPETQSIQELFSSAGKNVYLNFNYTEFLESVYGIAHDRINYIHGCRKDGRHGLILGHGENPDTNFNEWYDRNKNRFTVHEHRLFAVKRKNGHIAHPMRYESMTELAYFDPEPEKGNWKTPIRYYALARAVERIETYFADSRKKTEQIIEENKAWFHSLEGTDRIVVMGHSLSQVDHPYFRQILKVAPDAIWHISWYDSAGLRKIKEFTDALGIQPSKVELFRLS